MSQYIHYSPGQGTEEEIAQILAQVVNQVNLNTNMIDLLKSLVNNIVRWAAQQFSMIVSQFISNLIAENLREIPYIGPVLGLLANAVMGGLLASGVQAFSGVF